MAQADTRIFRLTSFSPIGFKQVNYPTQFCSLCRGYLNDVCSMCMEKGEDKCNVTNQNGSYYHSHCYTLMNTDIKKPKKTVAKKYAPNDISDSE